MATTGQISLRDIFVSVMADMLISCLTLPDLIALQGVSRHFRDGVREHRFNLNIFLKDFIHDPTPFRCQLGKADALIIRGAALNFLETQHRQFKYLDLLVEDGDKAQSLIDYLCTSEFYAIRAESTQTPPPSGMTVAQIERITTLCRKSELELLESTIRVRRTPTFPIHALLQNCCTTAELNFITWNKAYSLFPAATLARRKTYPLRPMDDDFGALLAELAHQGWTTRNMAWLELGDEIPYEPGPRRIGDAYSVCISVVPHIASTDKTPDYVIEHATFDVDVRNGYASGTHPDQIHRRYEMSIHATKLDSPALYHQFTVGRQHSWAFYVQQRLERWARVEMFKIPRTARRFSVDARGTLPTLHRNQRPSNWDYADDQIPAWYKTYRRSHMRSK
ncbi:hypothetical protein MY10362_008089 [Beauveria mimosiformis]